MIPSGSDVTSRPAAAARRAVPVTLVSAFAAVLPFAVLAALGLFSAWPSPDTPSYLAATDLAQPRLPLYGALLRHLPDAGLPLLQAGLWVVGVAALVGACRRFGATTAASLALGLALAFSNLALLWTNALLPELPGHALLLIALAASLDVASGRRVARSMVLAAVSLTLAWALLPALLPFVVLVPVLPVLLRPRRRSAYAWLCLACLLPPLLLGGVRHVRDGDFNIVSFGGFQMSGMAALMLTPSLADRLPPRDEPLAQDILRGRTALEQSGAAIAIPANSQNQRSFVSAALFYFDLLARTHDTVLYGAVAPLRGPHETWIAFNARLQRFALDTIRAAPVSYGAWVIGATARLVGHALVLNPVFVLATLLMLAMAFRPANGAASADWRLLLTLVGLYTLGSVALSVLITFPASRYIDSAALMLAAVPLYAGLRRLPWAA